MIRGTEVPERSTELDSYAILGPGSVFGLSELEPSYGGRNGWKYNSLRFLK